MARATRVHFPGAWYHVLNRGTERRAIFRSTRRCEKLIELLSSLPERFGGKAAGLRKELASLKNRSFIVYEVAYITSDSRHDKIGSHRAEFFQSFGRWAGHPF